MDQSTFDLIILAIFLSVGVYSLYTVLLLKRRGRLFENKLLYPANCAWKECADEEGYIAFIKPRLTIFGLLCLVMTGVEILRIFVLDSQIMAVNIVVFVLEILVFIYLAVSYNQAAKRYWTSDEEEE